MFGAIVLQEPFATDLARIDTVSHDVPGRFHGFKMVPPASWHYVGVKTGAHHVGFWCRLGINQVRVKVFDPASGQFADAPADVQAQHADPKFGGTMNPSLVPYHHVSFGPWYGLVMHIPDENFPPQLHTEDSGSGSRFHQALHGTHGGDNDAFLAEFQYAFASWYVSLPAATSDEDAFARWRHLVLAAYNAGEEAITGAGDLFPKLVDTLLHQFEVMGDEYFKSGSFLVSSQAGYMVEDLVDSGLPELVEKGQAFSAYLAKRQDQQVKNRPANRSRNAATVKETVMKVEILRSEKTDYWQLTLDGEKLACGLAMTFLPEEEYARMVNRQLKIQSLGTRESYSRKWTALEDQPDTSTVVIEVPHKIIEGLKKFSSTYK